jgi:3-oxoacyl-[acyl-carrier protein] reductase
MKTILITGTSSGIGKSLAMYYICKGYRVIGCSRRETTIKSPDYEHYQVDITDQKAVMKMISEIYDNHQSIDVLINNAGVASMNHSFLMPIDSICKILDTNVIGTFLMSRECAKIMMTHHQGRIVNFTSFAVPLKLEGEAVYAASKAAVITLTEILAREYAGFGITVNAVAPPAVETDMIKGVPKAKMDALLQRQAIHRYGTAEEVARVIDFFIDPLNGMITGQTIYMAGI